MSEGLRVLIVAGPNGAGKTTFAREHLPNEAGLPTFVNADLIAAGLSPFRPEAVAVRAGRVMLDEQGGHSIPDDVIRRGFVAGRESFEALYSPIVDDWSPYDGSRRTPALIDWKR